MNIFVTSSCPIQSAWVLDDKRVIKMILESTQLLSNVFGGPYKPTHMKHPCTLWLQDNARQQAWLYCHARALCSQYYARYSRTHKCEALLDAMYQSRRVIHTSHPLPEDSFVNCTPHKGLPVFEAYRKTLEEKWAKDVRTPKWFGSPVFPGWDI